MVTRTQKSEAEIRKLATRVRRELGVPNCASPDLVSVIKRLPNIIPGFELVKLPEEEMNGADAAADCEDNKLFVSHKVWFALESGQPRARMTMAHEIGHFVAGHTETKFRMRGVNYSERSNFLTGIEEREAKEFAPHFLAPLELSNACTNVTELADRFQLSNEAAEIHWRRIERARRQSLGNKRPLPDSVIDFLKAAREKGTIIRTPIDD